MSTFTERPSAMINLGKLNMTTIQHKSVVSSIIGIRGSNINRLTKLIPGVYIRLYNNKKGKDTRVSGIECDMIYITARSKDDVTKCMNILKKEIKLAIDGNLKNARPTVFLNCPREITGIVIGSNGIGLKNIQYKCGNGCFIIYDNNTSQFKITALTEYSILKAKYFIEEKITQYYKIQEKPKEKPKETPKETKSNNRYDTISFDDSSDSDNEICVNNDIIKVEPKVFVDVKSSSNEPSKEERWTIRSELALKKNIDGSLLYPSFYAKDYVTGKERHFEGVYAVPWNAVNNVISERNIKKNESSVSEEQKINSFTYKDTLFPSLNTNQPVLHNYKNENCWTNVSSVASPDSIKKIASPDSIKKVALKIPKTLITPPNMELSWADMCEDDSDFEY